MVRFNAPSAERETQTEAAEIRPSRPERVEQVVSIPTGETATFVLDLDKHALGIRAHS
jgi:hypothetical protein